MSDESKIHRVVWEIYTFGAKGPVEAAREALECMHDPESTAVVFDVYELDEDERIISHEKVDLMLEEGEQIVTEHYKDVPRSRS